MARKPNFERMYKDTMALIKSKEVKEPKKEVDLTVPEDFKNNGMESLMLKMETVKQQIEYFKDNQGNRLLPPSLQILYGRLLKVENDMERINETLVKVVIEDYETEYYKALGRLRELEEKEEEIEGQEKFEV